MEVQCLIAKFPAKTVIAAEGHTQELVRVARLQASANACTSRAPFMDSTPTHRD